MDGRPNRRNKAEFSCRISVDGRPNRRNKTAFSNSSGVAWKGTKKRSSIKRFETNSARSMLRVSFVFTPIKSLIYSQQSDETTLTKITTLTK